MARLAATVLALALVVSHSFATQGLDNQVPFNSTIVDKKFYGSNFCLTKFNNLSTLAPGRRNITYYPPVCRRCFINPTVRFCEEKIELFFTRRTSHPHIVRRPYYEIDIIKFPGATCNSRQPVEVSWPWGSARPKFISAFRKIANGAIFMRDFICTGKNSLPDPRPTPSDTRYIVDYLLALSWDFYFHI